MKAHKFFSKTLLVLTALGVASVAQAQFFNFDIDDTNGHSNYTGVGASGTVSFDVGGSDQVTVAITNDGTISPNSYISRFFILKPMIGATQVDASTLVSYTDSSNKDWFLDDEDHGSLLNEFYQNGSDYVGDYFGAEIHNSPPNNGLPQPTTHTFVFQMDAPLALVDWGAYNAMGSGPDAVPHIFVRWQEVANGDSAKGYDVWGDIPPPPVLVPEPSEIAAMGLLGMIGFLWARRRFMSRKKK